MTAAHQVEVMRSACCDGFVAEPSQLWWAGPSQQRPQQMCLDGFGGILFADEDFQEPQFSLDPLVLSVLLQHRHPVLLLNIPTAQETEFYFYNG